MDDWTELNGYEMAELNLPVGTQYQWWCSFRGSWLWREVSDRSRSYSRKCRISTADFNRAQAALEKAEQEEIVTIAKMTEAEAAEWHGKNACLKPYEVLQALGLIKPESTRAQRFHKETGIAIAPDIKLALEFDR